jgi:hypothetical protein
MSEMQVSYVIEAPVMNEQKISRDLWTPDFFSPDFIIFMWIDKPIEYQSIHQPEMFQPFEY